MSDGRRAPQAPTKSQRVFHVVARKTGWLCPDRPYAPASFAEEGFVHCSPGEPVTVVASALMVLLIDEHELDVTVRWEAASPGPSPASPPILYSRASTDASSGAVERMMEVQRGAGGRAVALAMWT